MFKTAFTTLTAIALGAGLLLGPVSQAQQAPAGDAVAQPMQTQTVTFQELISDWPEASQKAAKAMEQKYGAPSGVTPSRIIWQDQGPWKEIVVYRDPVDHDFPMPHKDVLEQVIEYQVPADKYDELAQYDGSVFAERTKGIMAARCDNEAANFLALNLADDIIKGEKSVEEARQAYAEAIQQFKAGQTPQIMQELAFQPPQQAGDPDVAVIQGQPGEAQPAAGQEMQQQDQQQQEPMPQ